MRSNDHDHDATVHLGSKFRSTQFLEVFYRSFKQFPALFLERNLSTSKDYHEFDFVSVLEELLGVPEFEGVIMRFDIRTHLNLFDTNCPLSFARLFVSFRLLEAIMTVVHDAAHVRLGFRGHFDQVETCLFGKFQGLFKRKHPKMLALLVYYSDFLFTDLVIDSRLGFRFFS